MTIAKATAKAEVASMLEALPDDSEFEDIQYHLYVLEKVKRGLMRADSEGVISHENAKARLDKWLAT
jgi:predicted transcriptional regulator